MSGSVKILVSGAVALAGAVWSASFAGPPAPAIQLASMEAAPQCAPDATGSITGITSAAQ